MSAASGENSYICLSNILKVNDISTQNKVERTTFLKCPNSITTMERVTRVSRKRTKAFKTLEDTCSML